MKKLSTALMLLFWGVVLSAQSYPRQYASLPQINRTFSVAIHVVVDSLGNTGIEQTDIQNAINNTNQLFAPIGADFELCSLDTLPNYRYDTLSRQREFIEVQSKFHQAHRINIYLVSLISDPFIPDDWGFTTPGGINLYNSGAIVIEKEFLNRALPHELGHFFGLLNTYENGNELVDGSNCATAGDRICDTAADPYNEGTPPASGINEECIFIREVEDANGDQYMPDVCNAMSRYFREGCGVDFSHEQLKRMAENYLNGPKLMW